MTVVHSISRSHGVRQGPDLVVGFCASEEGDRVTSDLTPPPTLCPIRPVVTHPSLIDVVDRRPALINVVGLNVLHNRVNDFLSTLDVLP